MMTLLLIVLAQNQVQVTNTKADTRAIATRCVNAAGTAFESCAGSGGAGSSWFPDGGSIGTVAISNFPAPDGGALGSVVVSNFPTQITFLNALIDGGTLVATQGTGIDGGRVWAIEGQVAITNFPASQVVTNANIDVALSTRTKPSDQQHTIIDSSATIATNASVTNFPAPDGGFIGQVAVTNFPAPDGGFLGTVTLTNPAPSSVSVSNFPAPDGGALGSVTVSSIVLDTFTNPPLNPFLQRCNAVRRTGCQP